MLRRAAATIVAEACSSAAPCLAAARPQAAASSLAPTASAQLQQARARSGGLSVDVPNGNVDRAWRALSRRVADERYMEVAQSRQFFVKPSERRKQEKSKAAKRFRSQEFKDMLSWIMRRRNTGF